MAPVWPSALLGVLGSCLGTAQADEAEDLQRLQKAYQGQARSEPQRPRLLERGDVVPLVLPPWSLDGANGNCTTLAVLAPPSTQFLVQLHPWPGSPGAVPSSAGAVQITRCGKDRVALLQVRLEMRSPRALVKPWVTVGALPPPALIRTLPARDAGPESPPVDPGPAPPRAPLGVRLQTFEAEARVGAATGSEIQRVASAGIARFTLEPGCHRLLVTGEDPSLPATLLLAEKDEDTPVRIEPEENGDARRELCTLRARHYQAALDAGGEAVEKTLAIAHYPAPVGLPERFGPEVAERLLQALGGSQAPQRLGRLVFASLGAQGLTPLPRTLLPNTCYIAGLVPVHGAAVALSLGVRAGAQTREATAGAADLGPRLGFCTGKDPRANLEVEARGLGVAWLLALFQLGPARVAEHT